MKSETWMERVRGCTRNFVGLAVCWSLLCAPASAQAASADGQAWAEVVAAAAGMQILGYFPESLPFTGQAVHVIKAIDRKTSRPTTICVDAAGLPLADCGVALRIAERQARYQNFGAIDDELWTHLMQTGDGEEIPVGIWLRTDEPLPTPKSVLLENPGLLASSDAVRLGAIQKARAQFEGEMEQYTRRQFRSVEGAPVVYTEMTAFEIMQVAHNKYIAHIGWQPEGQTQCNSNDTVYPTTDAATYAQSGYTGSGIGICIIEPDGPPSTCTTNFSSGGYCNATHTGTHSCVVGGTINSSSSPYGVATGASLYSATWASCDSNAAGAMNWCASNSKSVWSFSHTCSPLDNQLFDYWVKNSPYPSIAVASGNASNEGECCGTACTVARGTVSCSPFNAMVVGGSYDCDDSTRSNDSIWCGAADLNPADGRELPAIVAPAQAIYSSGIQYNNGTSMASPQVAGAFAQIQQVNSELTGWSEGGRSILMTTANHNVLSTEVFHNCILGSPDCRGGAGELNVAKATALANISNKKSHGNTAATATALGFDYDTLCDPAQRSDCAAWETVGAYSVINSKYYAHSSSSTNHLRVSLVWDSTAACTNVSTPSSAACSGDTLDADLDVFVYDNATGTLVQACNSSVNSHEFIDFVNDPTKTYRIEVHVFTWNSSLTYFGLSWDIVNMD